MVLEDGTSNAALAGGIAPSGTSLHRRMVTAPATISKQIEGQLFFNSTANAFKETIKDFTMVELGHQVEL